MFILRLGASGPDVSTLQSRLADHGFNPGQVDGDFADATEAAVIAFQKSQHLLPDGIVGAETSVALGLPAVPARADITSHVTVGMVTHMFPATRHRSIELNLPPVLAALSDAGLGDRPMVLTALATIRAEAAPFEPLSEDRSRFNTSPDGHAFDLYDHRSDLGNRGHGDGERFRGRGFVQLTGRANYAVYGPRLSPVVDLIANPDAAHECVTAARLLALFLHDKQARIRTAIWEDDLRTARRLVNGGSHGLNDFMDAFRAGDRVFPA